MKKKIDRLINRSGVGRRTIGDRTFRVFFFTGASLSWNLIFGIYNGVLGAIYSSSWFVVLCAYYLVLCVMRFSVMPILKNRSHKSRESNLMIFNGIVLLLLAFVLSFVVLVSFSSDAPNTHNTIIMISIAAYTFYGTILAIMNYVKAKKEKSTFMLTVRNISLAAATASMMSLERSMIATFSTEGIIFRYTMDACVGLGGFLVILAIGTSMIVEGMKQKRNGSHPYPPPVSLDRDDRGKSSISDNGRS